MYSMQRNTDSIMAFSDKHPRFVLYSGRSCISEASDTHDVIFIISAPCCEGFPTTT